jgi:hypothetical protein
MGISFAVLFEMVEGGKRARRCRWRRVSRGFNPLLLGFLGCSTSYQFDRRVCMRCEWGVDVVSWGCKSVSRVEVGRGVAL